MSGAAIAALQLKLLVDEWDGGIKMVDNCNATIKALGG